MDINYRKPGEIIQNISRHNKKQIALLNNSKGAKDIANNS